MIDLSQPAISVVMPLYNKEKDVARAIRSALAQRYHDFELIVVNDGSTDSSAEAVRGIDDSRIRLVEQENAGVAAARNRGIAEARADLVAFLDADDEWLPEFLATVIRLRESFPAAGVFATSYRVRDTKGHERSAVLRGLPASPWEGILDDYFALAAQSEPPVWSSAVAVKKEALEEIGGFPVGVRSGEDLLTWARLAARWPVAYGTEPQAVYCLWFDPYGTPTRAPSKEDVVGSGLEALLKIMPQPSELSLKHYIALWYRMRTSDCLRLGLSEQARAECRKMLCFATPGDWRVLAYRILSALPGFFQPAAFRSMASVKSFLERNRFLV